MALAFLTFLASFFFLPLTLASQVFVVGGEEGWTIPSPGKIDYQQWVSTINPRVGDSLEFNYYKYTHSVLQVIRSDYRYCNTTKPIANFQDGKTIIKLTKPGSYYFICGFPGHCEAGQKFMMRLPNNATAATPVATAPAAFEPALAPFGESLPPGHAIPPTTGATAPAAPVVPAPSEPALAPSGESLPPGHAIPPTTGVTAPAAPVVPAPSEPALAPSGESLPPSYAIPPTTGGTVPAAPVVPAPSEPSLAPFGESLPPGHAVSPTSGASAGAKSSTLLMMWAVMVAFLISVML